MAWCSPPLFCTNYHPSLVEQVRDPPSLEVGDGSIQFQTMLIIDDMSMQQMFQIYQHTQFQMPNLELYVEFELIEYQREMDEEKNASGNDIESEDEFEAYEVGDEDEDEDKNANDPLVQHAMQTFVRNESFWHYVLYTCFRPSRHESTDEIS
ncbi:hypothetical protein PIB30_055299 [Stylosanthes scabra]|uniref:Uncharacterized protein n=1 Tax=Stylosanthes scabra TaxID=79078 RepID=A0ABU6YGG2_9FABA|nr:hypothetical protein [Stylosanthes scabra]